MPKGINPRILIPLAILSPMIIPVAGLIVTIFCVSFLIKGRRCPICNGKDFKEIKK